MFEKCKKLEENLNRLGRVACIKLNNQLDAVALLVRGVKINLPLNNGTVNEPVVYPSTHLLNFIERFNPSIFQLEIRTLGKYFAKELKELDAFYAQVRGFGGEKENREQQNKKRKKNSRRNSGKFKKGFNHRKKVKK